MGPDPDVRSVFFGLLLAAFAVLSALIVEPFLSYVLAVLLFAFVLRPAQRRLATVVDPRLSAVALVGAAVAALALFVGWVVRTLPSDATDLSRAVRRVTEGAAVERRVERLLGVDVPVGSLLAEVPRRAAEVVVGDVSNLAGTVVHSFLGLVLFLFLSYYLLVEGDRVVAWVERVMPLPPDVSEALREEAYVTTWAVLKGHVFVAVVQGVVAGVGLLLVGIPHVAFLTVVMTFLELFPVVGVAAVLGPAVVYLAVTGRPLAGAFLLVYGLTAVAVVDDYLRARVVDRESSLHRGVILLGVFGGVYVFGVMGLFYGPIVLGLFVTLVRLFDENYGDGR